MHLRYSCVMKLRAPYNLIPHTYELRTYQLTTLTFALNYLQRKTFTVAASVKSGLGFSEFLETLESALSLLLKPISVFVPVSTYSRLCFYLFCLPDFILVAIFFSFVTLFYYYDYFPFLLVTLVISMRRYGTFLY